MSLIYKDDVGAEVIVDAIDTDIPATAVMSAYVLKPSGATAVWTLSYDYSAGTGTHTTVAGDLNEVGEYKIQLHGVFLDGDILNSNIDTFYVYEKVF
jgi:hypothetical protein